MRTSEYQNQPKLIQDIRVNTPLTTIYQYLIAQLPRRHFYTTYQMPNTAYDTLPEESIWDVRRVC